MGKLRTRLTYANVVSTICLFFVVAGGTAWAIDGYTGEDIVDGSLRSADYRNNDVRGVDVRDGTLTASDAACPAGTFEDRGLCFDSVVHPAANYAIAVDICAAAGGWLPSVSQLRPLRDITGIDLGNGATAHWADVIYTDANGTGNANRVMAVGDNGGIGASATPSQPYRCVYALLR